MVFEHYKTGTDASPYHLLADSVHKQVYTSAEWLKGNKHLKHASRMLQGGQNSESLGKYGWTVASPLKHKGNCKEWGLRGLHLAHKASSVPP